ncbi:hypothetical protein U879_21315 [Defluviimonas sp. 20V17]|nr:DUF6522 family protein [Allgaiera indica]KDB01662.1 hypothetical protein U879_21315 [Defluviimonas sp. 20V17]SDX35748.1 hypothetical protein SAMN05444006_11480 [Allgaiera indica]
MIGFENGTIQVDAEEIAPGLRLTPDEVMQGFRNGTITSVCEQGQDEDAGRHRLTFTSADRRLRLIVDAEGRVLKRLSADRAPARTGQQPEAGTDRARQTPTAASRIGGTK